MMRVNTVIGTGAAILLLTGCSGYGDDEVQSSSANLDAPIAPADAPVPPPLAPPPPPPPPPPPASGETEPSASATAINHRPTYEKILGNSGLSLQWISFYGAERGQLKAMMRGSTLYLAGKQKKMDQSGTLEINGTVVEVNDGSFIFDGTIAIKGTPDVSRTCIKNGRSEFAATQNRQYFRLREFEWCDGLTDYVDIYF